MNNLLNVQLKIDRYTFERELLNNRIEQFEGAGCNWKRVNRKMKISMLRRLNTVERRLRFWKMIYKKLRKSLKA